MGLAVVVTGNHFILDVAAGTAVALVGLWAAVVLDRHGGRVWNLVAPPSLRRAQA
jgi:membrane-associated phospholipid phosphatase